MQIGIKLFSFSFISDFYFRLLQ